MLDYLINLIGSFLSLPFLNYWFFPMIALAFIATVPCLIRAFFRR